MALRCSSDGGLAKGAECRCGLGDEFPLCHRIEYEQSYGDPTLPIAPTIQTSHRQRQKAKCECYVLPVTTNDDAMPLMFLLSIISQYQTYVS